MRTVENKAKTSGRSKDSTIEKLQTTINDLKLQNEKLQSQVHDHGYSASECDEKLAASEGSLRAELIRSEKLKKSRDKAMAAEHNQKSALGKCERALGRALEKKETLAEIKNPHQWSEQANAAVDDDSDFDFDSDLITDIVYSKDRYDHAPREGSQRTSHHLADDDLKMEGLEEEEVVEETESELETEPEPEPIGLGKTQQKKQQGYKVEPKRTQRTNPNISKEAPKKPPPKSTRKPPPPASSKREVGRKKPPPTKADLSKKRRQARQSLFASAEM